MVLRLRMDPRYQPAGMTTGDGALLPSWGDDWYGFRLFPTRSISSMARHAVPVTFPVG